MSFSKLERRDGADLRLNQAAGSLHIIQLSYNKEDTVHTMKITSFNPLIITRDSESAIRLFEELGFERHHKKEDIGREKSTDIRMKDANGFYVDVTQADDERTMIRVNVDNLDEAIEFLIAHGFHKARHPSANETVDTGSSRYNIMVSESGYILAVSQHIKDHE